MVHSRHALTLRSKSHKGFMRGVCLYVDITAQFLVCQMLCESVVCAAVYPMISRRRFQQLEVLEGQNILVTISGKKNKIRVYYLSWLKTKILKSDVVSLWFFCFYSNSVSQFHTKLTASPNSCYNLSIIL